MDQKTDDRSRFRFNFNVGVAGLIALILISVLGFAGYKAWDAKQDIILELSETNRQLRGELTEKERKFQDAKLEIGKARSLAISANEFAEKYHDENKRLRSLLNDKDAEITRISRAKFKIEQEIGGLKAEVETLRHGNAMSYRYTVPWFTFYTPDVFSYGGEKLTFDLYANLVVEGARLKGGILETERATLVFSDAEGRPIPLSATLTDYQFDYSVERPAKAPWWSYVHLDLFGGAATPYPWSFEQSRAVLGAQAQFWGAFIGVSGEATPEPDFRLMLSVGYIWRAF